MRNERRMLGSERGYGRPGVEKPYDARSLLYVTGSDTQTYFKLRAGIFYEGMKKATLTKICKGLIHIVGLVSFFILANLVFAETKVFIEEYTYQASEADSKILSRAIAFEQVKRLLLEKLGTYLESETEVKKD